VDADAEQSAIDALRSGRYGLAVERLTAAIAAKESAAAHFYLGVALSASGRHGEAVDHHGRTIALEPKHILAHLHRGQALRCLGRLTEALASYEAALEISANDFDVIIGRAAVLLDLRRFQEVLSGCARAIELRPDRAAEIYRMQTAALVGLDRFDEALHFAGEVIALQPRSAEALVARAHVLQQLGHYAEAHADSSKAIALAPQLAYAHFLNGAALRELRHIDQALKSFESVARLQPENAKAHFEIAWLNLLLGRFETGWHDYRQWGPAAQAGKAGRSAGRAWDGSKDISGKILFLHADQGLGDTIQFCRYALLAERRGAKVILSVQDGLGRLLRGLSPGVEVRERSAPVPAFDLHCALPNLPAAFGTTVDTVPIAVPYLVAEPDRVASWQRYLGAEGFKIGICWQGSSVSQVRGRSFEVQSLKRIATLPGIRLISLQKIDGTEQLDSPPMKGVVETLGEGFDSGRDKFLDTAAVMMNLDLVLSCDTSVVHIAGALARPAWVVLKYVPDWRWLLERSDSPWYPTLTLYRQSVAGSWDSVFESIYQSLAARLC
jgi:tetratricopeptide (TPR) repeat protein